MPKLDIGVSDNFEAITPSNTNLSTPTRALYVGTGGNLNVVPSCDGASSQLIANVPSGTMLYVSVVRVSSTGTTASNIVAFV
jgi:hypothetical protein